MKRGSSSSQSDWLSKTGCIPRRFYFRHDEAEFPAASQTAWYLKGSRAADRVPNVFGALRPFNNWAIIENQHELVSTGETSAPGARSVSTKGWPRAFPGSSRASSEEKNILADKSPHFLEETAAANENQLRNRVTASSNISNNRRSHGRSVNLSQSKSLRRVFTSAICRSTRRRAIYSSSSTASATSRTPRS